MKKLILLSGLFLILALALSTFGLHYYTELVLYPQGPASVAKAKPFEKFILADFRTLEKFPAFKKNEYKTDASDFLKTFLSSEDENNQKKANQIVERLFSAYPNWVTDKIHFKSLTADPQFADLNPKWLEKLKGFDHWSNASMLNDSEHSLLKNWAGVYAIKKLQTKDLNAGFKVYRKVAELINSAGNLNSQMIAATMLKSEHKLMNDFQARDWQLIPISSIEAYRRLSWAWISLGHQNFFEDLKSIYSDHAWPQFGACASFSENQINLATAQDFLQPRAWIEKDFKPYYTRVEKFQALLVDRCHANQVVHTTELSSLSEKDSTAPRRNLIRQIPIVRRFLGWNQFLAANPDTFNLYRELSHAKISE